LRSADLKHVVELATLRRERPCEQLVLDEQGVGADHHRDSDRRRVDVICALASIDVIDWVQKLVLTPLVAHDFQPAVGNDFVGVHVGAGASATLNHSDAELIVQFACNDLCTHLLDDLRLRRIERAEFEVGTGSGRGSTSANGSSEIGASANSSGPRSVTTACQRTPGARGRFQKRPPPACGQLAIPPGYGR